MKKAYGLEKIKALSDNDEAFIKTLALTFLDEVPEDASLLKQYVADKNYDQTYKIAHKLKPTVDLFDLGVLEDLIEIQDWGKYEKKDTNISKKLTIVLDAINAAVQEIEADFT